MGVNFRKLDTISVGGLLREGLRGDAEVASHVAVDCLDHIDVVNLELFEIVGNCIVACVSSFPPLKRILGHASDLHLRPAATAKDQ